MGTPSKFDTRQTWNHSALSAIGSSANATLDVILGDINSIFAAATSAPTPSVIMKRDANANTQVNNLIENGQEITSSGGTTILTVGSPYTNIITGTATQTVQLPAANTLTINQQFLVINNSTQSITVTNNGAATIQTMVTGSQAIFTVTNIGSANGTWSSAYSTGAAGGTVTSVTFTGDGTVLSSTPSSAVTTSGTLLATLNTQPSNTYLGGSYIAGTTADPTFKPFLSATIQQFGIAGATTYVPTYTFQTSSPVSVTSGARYTWNGINYLTVVVTLVSVTTFFAIATGGNQLAPPSSGTLTIHPGDTGPTTVAYTSWSNSPLYIRLEMVGAGGAGAAYEGGQVGVPGSGGNSVFTVINPITDSTITTLTAGGGHGATNTSNGYTQGGAGGSISFTNSTSINGIIVPGNPGHSAAAPLGNGSGGNGGASVTWGGAGYGGTYNSGPIAGSGGASPGAGGGGSSGASGGNGGGGGGSGGWFDVIVFNPWPSGSYYGYPITIGSGGVNSGGGGGNGAGGFIRITEYYQ